MAWKNLQQRSLAESMLIEHDALKELDAVHDLIMWTRIEALLSGIHSKAKGEKAWPPLIPNPQIETSKQQKALTV